jgi:hypothetical protein
LMRAQPIEGNLVFSPLSIGHALLMARWAADDATAAAIDEAFGLPACQLGRTRCVECPRAPRWWRATAPRSPSMRRRPQSSRSLTGCGHPRRRHPIRTRSD